LIRSVLFGAVVVGGILWNYASPGVRTLPAPPTPTPGYQAAVLALDPLLYWRLGDPNGSVTANNLGSAGAAQNLTYGADVVCGGSGLLTDPYDLDATSCSSPSGGVGIGNTSVATSLPTAITSFTFATWFQVINDGGCLTSEPTYQNFFALGNNGDDWFLGCFGATWQVYLNGSAQQVQSITTAVGDIFFMAETYDGAHLHFYMNGSQLGPSVAFSATVDITYGSGDFAFVGNDSDNEKVLGTFQEPFFINGVALSAGQIAALYEAGT
jgi:Concanavalin A-like lectin/glucanases superfamily